MVVFQRMGQWRTIVAQLCPIATALRADPNFRHTGSGKHHAAETVTALRTLQLIDRHGSLPGKRLLGQLGPHQLGALHQSSQLVDGNIALQQDQAAIGGDAEPVGGNHL